MCDSAVIGELQSHRVVSLACARNTSPTLPARPVGTDCGRSQVGLDGESGVVAAEFLLDSRHVPQRSEHQFIAQPFVDRAAEEHQSLVVLLAPASQRAKPTISAPCVSGASSGDWNAHGTIAVRQASVRMSIAL